MLYHFIPLGDSNFFGQMGDNQLGVELMGHSLNDRTRYSVALLSSNDGTPNLPSKNAYSTFITASQAFDAGYEGGVDRVGGYLFLGNGPTYNLTSFGEPLTAVGNKPFNREGVFALIYAKKLDFSAVLPARLGQRILRNQHAGQHAAAAGSESAFVERRIRGSSLRLQSANDLHPARRVRADVATGACRRLRAIPAIRTPIRSGSAITPSCSAGPGSLITPSIH